MRQSCELLIVAIFCACWPTNICHSKDPAVDAGKNLVAQSDLPGGVCVVVGCRNAQLPLSVARHGEFVVQVLLQDDAQLQSVREEIRASGQYGRVSADRFDGRHLPYAENLINLIIVEGPQQSNDLSLGEIERVLAPLGVVYLDAVRRESGRESGWPSDLRQQTQTAGLDASEVVQAAGNGDWLKATKRWPANIDQWSHHLHAADGNPVANDTVVGPPEHYQWVAGPLWAQSHESDSNVRCLVTARGRLYYIVNLAPQVWPVPTLLPIAGSSQPATPSMGCSSGRHRSTSGVGDSGNHLGSRPAQGLSRSTWTSESWRRATCCTSRWATKRRSARLTGEPVKCCRPTRTRTARRRFFTTTVAWR